MYSKKKSPKRRFLFYCKKNFIIENGIFLLYNRTKFIIKIKAMTKTDEIIEKTNKKIIKDYEVLRKVVDGLSAANHKIVVTIGSWDMLHIGHVRYLTNAKSHGDILIVGADSDRSIKLYKGEERPIIPEDERLEMLVYQLPVDFATLIDDVDDSGAWQYELIKALKPDVFVAVEDSYPESQLNDIRQYCKEVVVLPRQARTSTSATIEKAVKIRGVKALKELQAALKNVGDILEGKK